MANIVRRQAMALVSMRLARKSDLKDYTDLLQKTYQNTYADEKRGLTKNRFSKKVFSSDNSQNYLKSNLMQSSRQRTWLAFYGSRLIGSITIIRKGNACELRGFYVATGMQGRGIGRKLFQYALKFARNRDMVLITYAHNHRTIGIYKKWGFRIDKRKKAFCLHWPEWPKRLKAKCVYMRLSKKNRD